MQGAFLKLQSSQSTLNNNAAVADFEKRYGIKTGLRGQRIGDKIMSMDIPMEQKQILMKYLGEVNKGYAQGQAETQQSIQQQNTQGGVEFKGLIIPAEAVGILKGRPDQRMKEYFDKQFGPGAADRVLGGK